MLNPSEHTGAAPQVWPVLTAGLQSLWQPKLRAALTTDLLINNFIGIQKKSQDPLAKVLSGLLCHKLPEKHLFISNLPQAAKLHLLPLVGLDCLKLLSETPTLLVSHYSS